MLDSHDREADSVILKQHELRAYVEVLADGTFLIDGFQQERRLAEHMAHDLIYGIKQM